MFRLAFQPDKRHDFAYGWAVQRQVTQAMSDPKACRDRAFHCAELAKTTLNTRQRLTLLDVAQEWLNLATEIEDAHALLGEGHFGFEANGFHHAPDALAADGEEQAE